MKYVVVRQKNEVVSIIQTFNVMDLFLAEPPWWVKFINRQTGFLISKPWTQAYADKPLKKQQQN